MDPIHAGCEDSRAYKSATDALLLAGNTYNVPIFTTTEVFRNITRLNDGVHWDSGEDTKEAFHRMFVDCTRLASMLTIPQNLREEKLALGHCWFSSDADTSGVDDDTDVGALADSLAGVSVGDGNPGSSGGVTLPSTSSSNLNP